MKFRHYLGLARQRRIAKQANSGQHPAKLAKWYNLSYRKIMGIIHRQRRSEK